MVENRYKHPNTLHYLLQNFGIMATCSCDSPFPALEKIALRGPIAHCVCFIEGLRAVSKLAAQHLHLKATDRMVDFPRMERFQRTISPVLGANLRTLHIWTTHVNFMAITLNPFFRHGNFVSIIIPIQAERPKTQLLTNTARSRWPGLKVLDFSPNPNTL
jgi:hypothetical protein